MTTAFSTSREAADWIKVETAGGSGACQLGAEVVTGRARSPDVLTTGVGWWRPEAAAPHFGARDVNINAALSYRERWDRGEWARQPTRAAFQARISGGSDLNEAAGRRPAAS